MRWRFANLKDPREAKQYQSVNAKIDAWWKEFAAKTDDLRALFKQQADWDLAEWMQNHLQSIHPHLMWEYGRAVRGEGYRLAITPESRHFLRPLTCTILERAPQLDDWEFYSHRVPEDVENAKLTVEARVDEYDISDFQVQVRQGDQHRVDLCYLSPRISSEEDERARHAAFVATETLLGEECLDRWIGAIEIGPLPKSGGLRSLLGKAAAPAGVLPLERMQETVTALIGSIREQLPDRPHFEWVNDAEWTLWELSPEESDDYLEQTDLYVARSPSPAMWTAAHSSGLFFSERFSRCGETFCYLKLDGSDGLEESKFGGKDEIEEALDAVLVSQKLGCPIGGGTGRRYSYVDLALVDVDRGIEAVRKRMQEGNVPKRSWIQFFDVDLAAEWVGIYDDSPPPPMPDFEE